jgi:hypothetical protein
MPVVCSEKDMDGRRREKDNASSLGFEDKLRLSADKLHWCAGTGNVAGEG